MAKKEFVFGREGGRWVEVEERSDLGEKEGEKERIIRKNVEMLSSEKARSVLSEESMGQNAGTYEDDDGNIYSCIAINGYADDKGLILDIGNIQYISEDIIRRGKEFRIKYAVGYYETTPFEVFTEDENVKQIIDKSIKQYRKEENLQMPPRTRK